MTLTLKSALFLIAAIIFGLDAFFGYFAGEPYGRFHPRVQSFAFCLAMIAWFLWAGGK